MERQDRQTFAAHPLIAIPPADAIATPVLVIGAGPAGLFHVFQLGLQGIAAQVVDVWPEPGGQCVALYGDKPIYDIPGLPQTSGRELTAQLLAQAAPFKPGLHLGHLVSRLQRLDDGRWWLVTQAQNPALAPLHFVAQTVCIAAGVGAFVPKMPAVPGLQAWVGTQVSHGLCANQSLAGQRVVVLGGDAQAVDAALALARREDNQRPSTVTLLHRRDQFEGDPRALAELHTLRAAGHIHVQAGQLQGLVTTDAAQGPGAAQRLTALTLETPEGQVATLALDHLLVCLGMSPRLGPLADWGLAMQRKQLLVDSATLATSGAGIYAIGDVVSYPGKRRLIVCAFHEATLAAFAIGRQLNPDAPDVLLYTSSSALLQQRLGLPG